MTDALAVAPEAAPVSDPAPDAGLLDNNAEAGVRNEDQPDAGAVAIRTLAEEMGWKPKDKWGGKETGWVDADAFIKAQSRRAKTAEESYKKAIRVAEKAADSARKQAQQSAEARIREAIEAQDADGALEAARDLANASQNSPVDRFVIDNPWFSTDDVAKGIALGAADRAAKAGLSVEEQLDAAKAEVRKRMPEIFGEDEPDPEPKKTKAAPAVEGGQRVPGAPRKKGLSDVPAAIRAQWTPKTLRSFAITAEEMASAYWAENNG